MIPECIRLLLLLLMVVIFIHFLSLGSGQVRKACTCRCPPASLSRAGMWRGIRPLNVTPAAPKGAPSFCIGLGMTSLYHAVMKRTLKVSHSAQCHCGNVFLKRVSNLSANSLNEKNQTNTASQDKGSRNQATVMSQRAS